MRPCSHDGFVIRRFVWVDFIMARFHSLFVSGAKLLILASTSIALSSSISYAQRNDAPLDLTVLSTAEDNLSTVDEKLAVADNASDDMRDDISDDVGAAEALISDNASDNVAEFIVETAPEVTTEVSTEAATDITGEVISEATSGRMKRRTIKDVGLASIGIGDGDVDGLDALDNRLWRGVPLARAMALIDHVPVPLASDALRRMSYHVVARQAVPPKGAAENPSALLSARMNYLSRVGRSDGLAAIITQLPENEDWADWHLWRLFYDLMKRDDERACAIAAENATTSLEPLWQKTNLMCQILTGDEVRAAFSADVLKASGLIDDPLYFDLVDVLLRRRNADSITGDVLDNQPIDFMHVILMDAAHVNIGAAQLASLDNSYAQAANALRYLADDARQSLGMGNLRAGLISPDDAKALFIASTQRPDSPLMAMSRRLEANDGQADSAAVMLFMAIREALLEAETLDHNGAEELVLLILSAISTEVRAGDGAIWLPLYAPYLSDAMAQVNMKEVAAKTQMDYAMALSLAGLPLTPLPTDGMAVVMADHALIAANDSAPIGARIEALRRLGMTDLLPLLLGQAEDSQNWLDAYLAEDAFSKSVAYQPLSQTGLHALDVAAAQGQRAEAVIIAARLTSDKALHLTSPSQQAQVATALAEATLPKTAQAFVREALLAHMMTALLGPIAGDEGQ